MYNIDNIRIVTLFIAIVIFFDFIPYINGTKLSESFCDCDNSKKTSMDKVNSVVESDEDIDDKIKEEENDIEFDEESLSKLAQSNE